MNTMFFHGGKVPLNGDRDDYIILTRSVPHICTQINKACCDGVKIYAQKRQVNRIDAYIGTNVGKRMSFSQSQ